MKKITLGFSPCPNDTYIFDALVNKRIDTGNFQFETVLEDVEQLNQMASSGKLNVTKLSVGAYAKVSSNYIILDSGSALGLGVGPLLVSKEKIDLNSNSASIAIPGKYTTANLLLSIFFPHFKNKTEVLFSDIENTVLSGKADIGLLIHEGRFTYMKKNLIKLADLGEVWERKMKFPLPLGCICASRNMDSADRTAICNLIKESILYARKHPLEGKEYIKAHSQEMEDDVIEKHIALYVNDFSVALGSEGRNAIEFLLKQGYENGLLPQVTFPIFN